MTPTTTDQDPLGTLCSPRFENTLTQASGNLRSGQVRFDEELVERFRKADAEEPQRAPQDLGLSLCGQQGRRLAADVHGVTCPECRRLLSPAVLVRPGTPVKVPVDK